MGAKLGGGEDLIGVGWPPIQSGEFDDGRLIQRLICWKTSVTLRGSGSVTDEGKAGWHSGWFPADCR